jgi:hypothetical protein
MWAYFTYEKERIARKRIADQTKGIGKPKVGGPFQLVDQEGNAFTSDDMLGKYSLVCRNSPLQLQQEKTLLINHFTGLLRLHTLPRHLPR